MKRFTERLSIFFLIVLTVITGCKKDDTNEPINLLAKATEYNGTYPDPQEVSFTEAGVATTVNAFPEQALVFFKSDVKESEATQIITSSGGTVLAKIPNIGYYFVSSGSGQLNSLLNGLQDNTQVEMAFPHVSGSLSTMATILDGCDISHGQQVQDNLEYCGGTMEKCVNIRGADTYVLWNKIVQAITSEANSKKGAVVLINISASGFNKYDNRKWPQLTVDEQARVSADWFYFMRGLFALYNFPESMRKNVVITIAAGNGDMPITDLMNKLKQNAKMAEILNNNVLVVSNTSLSIGKGNYSATDPDVVVVDTSSTPDAYGGTSFSAPCALGLVQRLIDEKGQSPIEALKLLKVASQMDAKRVVKWEKLLKLIGGAERFIGGNYQVVDTGSFATSLIKHTTDIHSMELLWLPVSGQTNGEDYGFGYLTVRATVKQDCLTNCGDPAHVTVEVVMTQDSADYIANNVSGIASAPVSGTYTLLGFVGTRSGNTITGYVYLPNIPYADRNRVNVVLQKQ